MAESAAGRRLGVLAGAALLIAVGTMSFVRASRNEWDFSHFYHDARDVWEHGALHPFIDPAGGDAGRRLPFYLPAVPALLAPLTAFGRSPAAVFWAALQVVSLGYCLVALRRRWTSSSGAFWLAICLALPALYEAAKFNQLSFPVLALILAAFEAFERRRPVGGALALGLAIMLKLLPVIFVVWLCLKRRWSAAFLTLAAAALYASVPALIAFGPTQTATHYSEWWSFNVGGDSARGLLGATRREHFVDHRNQSITQVLLRWTSPEHPFRTGWQPVQLASATTIGIARCLAAALFVALLWLTRRAARTLPAETLRSEWAVYAIAMLALAPLVRQYYLVWALPGLVRLASGAEARRGRLAVAGLAIWTLGMLAWVSPVEAWGEAARQGGVHLAVLLAIGAVLLLGGASQGRRDDRGGFSDAGEP